MKAYIVCIFLMVAAPIVVFSHGGKKHKKESQKTHSDSVKAEHDDDITPHHDEGMKKDPSEDATHRDEFPTLHPLIVHFAIVLILVAAALQLLNIVLVKKELAWIAAGILLIGVAAAWLASGQFHPHTHGISAHAQSVLNLHDKWANWTKISGLIGTLLQLTNLFIFQSKRWAMAIVAIVLAVSAYSVSRAGYYGSQLVHIEGIGPQGKYLETDDDD